MALSMVKPMSTEHWGLEQGRGSTVMGQDDFDRAGFREMLAQFQEQGNFPRVTGRERMESKEAKEDKKLPNRRRKNLVFDKDLPLFLQDTEKDLILAFKDMVLEIPWEKHDLAQGAKLISRFLGEGRSAIEAAFNLFDKGSGLASPEIMLANIAGRAIKRAVFKSLVGPENDKGRAETVSPVIPKVARKVQNAKTPLAEPNLFQANKETVMNSDFRKAFLQEGKIALKEDYFGERDRLLREYTDFAKGKDHLGSFGSGPENNDGSSVVFSPTSGELIRVQRRDTRVGQNKLGPNRKTIAGTKAITEGGVEMGEKPTGDLAVKPGQSFFLSATKHEDFGIKEKGTSWIPTKGKVAGRESTSPTVSRVNEKEWPGENIFWDPLSLRQQPNATAAKVNGSYATMLLQPQELFEQIIAEARLSNLGRGGEMSIKLKPDYLGGLKMKVAVEDGQLKATFIVDNPLVKEVLETNMEALKSGLQKQGLNYQTVDVNVNDGGKRHSFSQPNFSDRLKGSGKGVAVEEIREGRQYTTGQVDYRI